MKVEDRYIFASVCAYLAQGAIQHAVNQDADLSPFNGQCGYTDEVLGFAPLVSALQKKIIEVGNDHGLFVYDIAEQCGALIGEILITQGDVIQENVIDILVDLLIDGGWYKSGTECHLDLLDAMKYLPDF